MTAASPAVLSGCRTTTEYVRKSGLNRCCAALDTAKIGDDENDRQLEPHRDAHREDGGDIKEAPRVRGPA